MSKPEPIEQKCSTCHESSVVYEKKRTMVEWERLIYGHVSGYKLELSPDEKKAILEILEKDYRLK
jgi:hypothetical protein